MMNQFEAKEEDIFSGGKIDPKKFKVQKDDEDFGKWSSLAANIKQEQLEYEKVDLQVGDKNLQLGLEIRDIGVDILTNLETQAGSIYFLFFSIIIYSFYPSLILLLFSLLLFYY